MFFFHFSPEGYGFFTFLGIVLTIRLSSTNHHMRMRLMSVLLILIVLLNVFNVSENFETVSSSQTSIVNSANSVELASNSEHQAHETGAEHDQCHNCHIGHCQFLITSTISFDYLSNHQSYSRNSSLTHSGPDLSGLRRPPRA